MLLCLLLAGFGLLAAADAGRFNAPLARYASRRLDRPVSFQALHTHLLSGRPTVTLGGLRMGQPAWAGPGDLLRADAVRLAFAWPGLAVTGIEVDRPTLNLVRLSPDRANWSSGKGDRGGDSRLLDSVRLLRITGGRFSLDDRVGDLRLSGTLVHDAAADPARPLKLTAEGVLKGGAIQASAQGGALNHRRRNTPYPFSARLRDGETFVGVSGVSAGPGRFKDGYDLAIAARGPNLADTRYLIDESLPNSAPYRLTVRLVREGRTVRATGLKAVVGRSDFTGSIVSDGSRPRRRIVVDLDSRTLYAADVDALLSHIPPHRLTRSVSGAKVPGKGGGPLFNSRPIDLTRFRRKDARLDIRAERFVLGQISPGRLHAVGVLREGRLELKPFTLAFPSGRADLALALDVNGPHPAFRLDGTVRQAALSSLAPGLARTISGVADLRIRAAGAGSSFHAMALNATGGIGLTLRNGQIQAAKADVLSGAVIQGAFKALANKSARSGVPCALADLGLGGGRITSRRILLVTDAGAAVGQGQVDLASETVDLTIYGRPSGFRLFAVKAPITLTGPMLHPQAKVRLGGRPAGETGPVPEAPKITGDPAAFCSQQLAGAP